VRSKKIVLGVSAAALSLLAACGTSQAVQGSPSATGASDTTTSASTTASSTTEPTTTTDPTTTTTTSTTTSKPKPTTTTTKPTPKSTQAPQPAQGAPCSATAKACIDLSANKSWLLRDGQVIAGPFPITHGRPGYRTPPGTFHVQFKDKNHKSSIFNDAPMPYSVFFNSGIAFHAGSLRVPSHGCIHLSNAVAAQYFNYLNVGDVVQVVP
jgi:lipoprotein-anchoring transpeptidase ErfK/SrfK